MYFLSQKVQYKKCLFEQVQGFVRKYSQSILKNKHYLLNGNTEKHPWQKNDGK